MEVGDGFTDSRKTFSGVLGTAVKPVNLEIMSFSGFTFTEILSPHA